MRELQSLLTAKAALKGAVTFRSIRRAEFESCEIGVLNEIRFVQGLFEDRKLAA